ncbi:SHOCT domain-containing protein [Actinomadura gamaensis]|uniref:SHOCT domain-containing protein n=1 Tax=Actinomadura gamaensis TaxID=1763541 RepID=A0ABV9UB75_9ACTN
MHSLMITAAHPGWHDHSGPGWWVIFPITFGLLWLTALGFVGFQLAKRRRRGGWRFPQAANPQPGAGKQRPEDLLAERFARGEVDEDEFHSRMSALRAERE